MCAARITRAPLEVGDTSYSSPYVHVEGASPSCYVTYAYGLVLLRSVRLLFMTTLCSALSSEPNYRVVLSSISHMPFG